MCKKQTSWVFPTCRCEAWLTRPQHYSDYSEAYSLPGDIKRKGAHFQVEAESYLKKHQFESRDETRLSSLQATLLLYERYVIHIQCQLSMV